MGSSDSDSCKLGIYNAEIKINTAMMPYFRSYILAERGGFEPPKGFDSFTGLANQRTRPLCDLSNNSNIICQLSIFFNLKTPLCAGFFSRIEVRRFLRRFLYLSPI
jgi:hypothetical protein